MIKGLRDISCFNHEKYLDFALEEALIAGERGDLPIGAVIVHNDKILAKSSNKIYTNNTLVHHAENTAVLSCAAYLRKHGPDCIIYTTLEPCIMCLSTIIMSNIRNVVFCLEDKFMNTRESIRGYAWMEDRIFNYIGGIKREASKEFIIKYCNDNDRKTILEGIKISGN